MARVLCTGVDEVLLQTRRLILEKAGHEVVTATTEPALITACKEYSFDVAVIGQALPTNLKRRTSMLIRQFCADVKVLELYERHRARVLDDADMWLAVPSEAPRDLADRVTDLAPKTKAKGS